METKLKLVPIEQATNGELCAMARYAGLDAFPKYEHLVESAVYTHAERTRCIDVLHKFGYHSIALSAWREVDLSTTMLRVGAGDFDVCKHYVPANTEAWLLTTDFVESPKKGGSKSLAEIVVVKDSEHHYYFHYLLKVIVPVGKSVVIKTLKRRRIDMWITPQGRWFSTQSKTLSDTASDCFALAIQSMNFKVK